MHGKMIIVMTVVKPFSRETRAILVFRGFHVSLLLIIERFDCHHTFTRSRDQGPDHICVLPI